jgi:hypothetical protein
MIARRGRATTAACRNGRSNLDVVREGIALIAKPYRADALSDAIRQALAQAGAGVRETG